MTGIVDGLAAANNETLTYTDAARLLSASSTGTYGTRAWTYDGNGNRLSETANGVVNSYAYPANNNRLTNVKQGTLTTRAFTYDAAGSVTQDLRGSSAYNYAVNAAGRIKTLTIGATLKATWTYDGFQKLRVKAATSPAATTHYVWDSFGHIIAEHNATGGAALKQYIWLGDTPLAVFDNTTLYYVHPDHLDRPVAMTNAATMTIAWQAKYDPFGNPVAVTISPVNNQRLPGQWFQLEDGLTYNWHRSYDPTLGRYSQADPLGFVDGPGVYNYAGSSPVMLVDPSGRCLEDLCIGESMLAAALASGAIDAALQYWNCGKVDWGHVAQSAAIGGAIGGLTAGFGGVFWGGAGRAAGGLGAAGRGLGAGEGTGLGAGAGGEIGAGGKWKLGLGKSAQKWAEQMEGRGWTTRQIDDAVKSGQKFTAPNNLNPLNGATRYVNPQTGRSVVLDNVTGEVLHVGGDGFRY